MGKRKAHLSEPGFFDRLRASSAHKESLLCIGLDPDPRLIQGGIKGALDHATSIVEQTADLACCYKPNSAFWEQYGPGGWDALARLRREVPSDIPLLLDAKRSDVAHTMEAYASAIFGVMNMSAVTVHAYHGKDSLRPFTDWADRGVYVVALSSNPGGSDLQQLQSRGTRIFEHVAHLAMDATENSNVGIVAGATEPDLVARLRKRYPGLPFLMPGVGAQGADISAAVLAAFNGDPASCLLSASRSIFYSETPRRAAISLRDRINRAVEI